MGNPKRARSWKRRIQPRVGLKAVEPVLYSTLFDPFSAAIVDSLTARPEKRVAIISTKMLF